MTQDIYEFVASDRARLRRDASKTGPFPAMSAAQFLQPFYNGGFPAEYKDGLWAVGLRECEVIPIRLRMPHGARDVLKKTAFHYSVDQCFATVLNECAKPRPKGQFRDVWLGPKTALCLLDLHRLGAAHSIEIWLANRLVGCTFGVQMGAAYTSLSLCSRVNGAGKVAFMALNKTLADHRFDLHLGLLPSNTSRFFGGALMWERDLAPLRRRAMARQLAIAPRTANLLSFNLA